MRVYIVNIINSDPLRYRRRFRKRKKTYKYNKRIGIFYDADDV